MMKLKAHFNHVEILGALLMSSRASGTQAIWAAVADERIEIKIETEPKGKGQSRSMPIEQPK
jgi:hypothetical protein